ncbi:hypothetical protein AB0M12_17525 [Nocardia vinacea]|uniref:hypothetical protein n=1 Tax=Nocardia vinacea TaxID=96468 RepID=UPI0034156ECB
MRGPEWLSHGLGAIWHGPEVVTTSMSPTIDQGSEEVVAEHIGEVVVGPEFRQPR